MSKSAKESFVSNLSGSSVYHIIQVEAAIIAAYWIYKLIASGRKTYYILEFIILILPLLLSITILSDYISYVLLAAAGIILYLQRSHKNPTQASTTNPLQESYINGFRSILQLMTCIAILAVDFNVFPRRNAKTEIFGTSLVRFRGLCRWM